MADARYARAALYSRLLRQPQTTDWRTPNPRHRTIFERTVFVDGRPDCRLLYSELLRSRQTYLEELGMSVFIEHCVARGALEPIEALVAFTIEFAKINGRIFSGLGARRPFALLMRDVIKSASARGRLDIIHRLTSPWVLQRWHNKRTAEHYIRRYWP